MARQRGRKRLAFCSAGLHPLTDANRRWKFYVRADGSSCLLANGCRLCNNDHSKERRCGLRGAHTS